ncbi:Hypothetical protein NTJ_13917 [Nesidiocoris tenuis]|uniref:Uncharacterized protein n=1 Tax=Nesidiocoris tenuis TaxID=355587 RepID=A0ABN7BBR8_9HEMI|nr:Hypothetical protein NTJ_13917 [Nesidiocoris tenuis]
MSKELLGRISGPSHSGKSSSLVLQGDWRSSDAVSLSSCHQGDATGPMKEKRNLIEIRAPYPDFDVIWPMQYLPKAPTNSVQLLTALRHFH